MIIKKRNQKSGEVKKIQQEVSKQETPVEVVVTPDSALEPPAIVEEIVQEVVPESESEPEPEIDLFDIENIDFTQRQERRRGSRRRGYRRIDDRNLVSRAQEESENIKNLHLKKVIVLD